MHRCCLQPTQVRLIQAYWLWQRLHIFLSVFWHRLRRSRRAEGARPHVRVSFWRGAGVGEGRDRGGEALDVTEWSGSLANSINYSQEFWWSGPVVLWFKAASDLTAHRSCSGLLGRRRRQRFSCMMAKKSNKNEFESKWKQSQEAVRIFRILLFRKASRSLVPCFCTILDIICILHT